jgi:hypothetical protein
MEQGQQNAELVCLGCTLPFCDARFRGCMYAQITQGGFSERNKRAAKTRQKNHWNSVVKPKLEALRIAKRATA